MQTAKIFSGLILSVLLLTFISSCTKEWHVNDEYLGEYLGAFIVMRDSVVILENDMGTVLVEKEGKKKYLISSPTHSQYFPSAVYEIDKELVKDRPEGVLQSGFRTDDPDWSFTISRDSITETITLLVGDGKLSDVTQFLGYKVP